MRNVLSILLLLSLGGCTGATVKALLGPVDVMVSSSQFGVPAELHASGSNAQIAMVPCSATMACPVVELECNEGFCDPPAKTVDFPVGDVLDLDEAQGFSDGSKALESISIDALHALVQQNTLTVDLPAVQISWGPENASSFDPSHAFATLRSLPAGSTSWGDATLDEDKIAALSDYLLDTSHRIRLYARTTVDLEPGQRFPEGALDFDASVELSVTTKSLASAF